MASHALFKTVSDVQTVLLDTLEPAFHAPAAAGMGEDRIKDMCLLFARKEKILGEIDRARAIYTHASQSAAEA